MSGTRLHVNVAQLKVPRTILEYISKLSPTEQDGLYTDRFAVLTVFQSLSPLAKQYVLRLVPMGDSATISRAALDAWFNKDHGSGSGGSAGAGAGSYSSLAAPSSAPADREASRGKEHRLAREHLLSLRVLIKTAPASSSSSSSSAALAFSPFTPLPAIPAASIPSASSSASSTFSSSTSSSSSATSSTEEYRLHPFFARFLLDEICGGAGSGSSAGEGGGGGGGDELDGGGVDGKEAAQAQAQVRKKLIAPAVIEQAVEEEWAKLLFFLLRISAPGVPRPADSALLLMQEMGLLVAQQPPGQQAGQGQQPAFHITARGYSFLFKTPQERVWDVLLAYMSSERVRASWGASAAGAQMQAPQQGKGAAGAGAAATAKAEVLRLLFRLSYLPVGESADATRFTPAQLRAVRDLREFGLVYLGAGDEAGAAAPDAQGLLRLRRCYSTPLTAALSAPPAAQQQQQQQQRGGAGAGAQGQAPQASASASASAAAASARSSVGAHDYVIVETTFRVFAFTTNPVVIHTLALFARLESLLPNAVVGSLTRSSVDAAARRGIAAQDILRWLRAHAHPQTTAAAALRASGASASASAAAMAAAHGGGVPRTVEEQVLAWYRQRDRLSGGPCLMLSFDSHEEFEFWREKLSAKHVAIVAHTHERTILATRDAEEIFQEERKREADMRKAGAGAGGGF